MGGFQIGVQSNIEDLIRTLGIYERDQIPFVTAYALTKVAYDIKDEEVQVMARVFDRPTRFTLNSLYVEAATKRRLQAAVRFKEGFGSVPAWRYLGPLVDGGPRAKKGHERALERAGILQPSEFVIPGRGVKLDAFGNMKGSEITRILSALGANPDRLSNKTAASAKRNKNWARYKYVVIRGARGLRDGIYHRKARQIVPIMIFVSQPRYRPIYPHQRTAREIFRLNFGRRFQEGVNRFIQPRTPKARWV